MATLATKVTMAALISPPLSFSHNGHPPVIPVDDLTVTKHTFIAAEFILAQHLRDMLTPPFSWSSSLFTAGSTIALCRACGNTE